jgi:hypothetical protein
LFRGGLENGGNILKGYTRTKKQVSVWNWDTWSFDKTWEYIEKYAKNLGKPFIEAATGGYAEDKDPDQ